MSFRSNLGQNGGPSSGAPSGGAPAAPAAPANQGGISAPFSGAFPIGVPPYTGVCPSGWLPAPSAMVPGGYTCVRAPGSYTVPMYMSGRRR